MLNLNNLQPNELFIRIYYVPNYQSEIENVRELKQIATRLAHSLFICNSNDLNGKNIGVSLVNGGVVRRQFRNYQGMVMVINEKYAFQDDQEFFLRGDGQYTDDEYCNTLAIIANYLSLIPGTQYTPNPDLRFSSGFVWKSQSRMRDNFRVFDN